MSRSVVFLGATLLLVSQAKAALVYELVFSQPNVVLNVGGSTSLGVLFREIATGGDSHRLDMVGGSSGLTTANFAGTKLGAGANVISSVTGNALFNFPGSPTVTGGDPTFSVQQDVLLTPVFATSQTAVAGGTMRSVQIGTVNITGSSVVGHVNTIQLADFAPGVGVDDFVISDFINNFAADGVMSFGSVTISSIPEPSSLALLGMVGSLGFWCQYRRRQAKQRSLNSAHAG